MSYKKKNDDSVYEAEQLKNDSLINCNGGDVPVPAGYWVVKLGDAIVECPSDIAFKEQYSSASATKQVKEKQPVADSEK